MYKEKGMYQGKKTLSDDVTPQTLTLFKEHLGQLNMNIEPFLTLKPWMISLQIDDWEMQRLGYNSQMGIDIHFCGLHSAIRKSWNWNNWKKKSSS